MAEADARLLEWASASKGAGEDPMASAQFQKDLAMYNPLWDRYVDASAAQGLRNLLIFPSGDLSAVAGMKKRLAENPSILKSCMDVMMVKDESKPKQYILTILYDMLRQDSSCFQLFEDAMKSGVKFYQPLMSNLNDGPGTDVYVVDRAAWLLSSIMSASPRFFSDAELASFLRALLDNHKITQLGQLEALTNLLKEDSFRKIVYAKQGVTDLIFHVTSSSSSPVLYRCVFAIWMLASDKDILGDMKNFHVSRKINEILANSRSEKVVRLCLTALDKMLTNKAMAEDVVEENVLDTVQQLEYEKWRDAELYDDIHDIAEKIQAKVASLSNFDRYERELNTGKLKNGYIHSGKFWQENVMKFESNNFRALNTLAGLLMSHADNITLAVACCDMGQFVTLHPLGRKKANQLGVKERVMELMSSTDPDMRDVRREALLCCQKLMLNKWADVAEKA